MNCIVCSKLVDINSDNGLGWSQNGELKGAIHLPVCAGAYMLVTYPEKIDAASMLHALHLVVFYPDGP